MADNIAVVITEVVPNIDVDILKTIVDIDVVVSDKGSPGNPGEDGTDGREVEIHSSGIYIQWKYVGDPDWIDLVALADLEGSDGIDGREVTLRSDGTYIQWQYIGDSTWTNIVALATLKGDKGDAGTTTWAGITDKPPDFMPSVHDNTAHSVQYATVDLIPDALADLSDDENHRTVTDTEKAAWGASIVPGGSDTNIQFNDAGIFGGVDAFKYDRLSGAITIGESVEILPNVPLAIEKDIDDYVQVTFQNKSDSPNASMDIVITADNGTDATHYLDLGVNSSGYSDPDFPIIGANAGYLYSTDDNVVIGTGGIGKKVTLFSGGYATENISAQIDEDGINLPSGKTVRINGVPIGASPDFLALTDTPDSYTGEAGKVVSVNPTENGLVFTSISGLGNMQSSVYDPRAIADDAFDVDNHTSGTINAVFSQTEKTKLSGIAFGAEVNVQPDWNQMSSSADDYIKNKPTIPSSLTPATTVVSETTPGQTPVVGIASEYARADHSHGTPAAGSGVSEALAIAFSVALGGI